MRIGLKRLPEVCDALLQNGFRALVPEVAALQ
jgi:hypothetical protein